MFLCCCTVIEIFLNRKLVSNFTGVWQILLRILLRICCVNHTEFDNFAFLLHICWGLCGWVQNWVKPDMMMAVDGTRQRGCPRKSWSHDVKEDMKTFGLHRLGMQGEGKPRKQPVYLEWGCVVGKNDFGLVLQITAVSVRLYKIRGFGFSVRFLHCVLFNVYDARSDVLPC